jgi:[glutamine synthetase] adenylyltransferase / [glutamine synthetase]-adenylyl-L-tyrosine phosphorylase
MTIRGIRDANVASTSLVARLTSGPLLFAPKIADRLFQEWLSAIDAGQAAELGAMFGRFPRLRTIFAGIAEASPYLFDLLNADAARVLRILRSDPDQHLKLLIEDARQQVWTASSEADAMRLLRSAKAEAALLIALCDIGGVWPVMRVTAALTDLATASARSALRFLLRGEAARKRILPPKADRPEDGSGLIILAMGKMGAGELNFSSDIDLIAFYDPDRCSLAPDIEPQPFFVRVTQGLSRMLQQRSGEGYVFRVDLRLRPDPASTPVAISIASAVNYYEREGRTWERAAMIKARPCAGDLEAGEALVRELSPFVWRKHLDFAALADVHDMKRQMQTYRGQSEIAVEGHNVKVGRGGIREIEFFVQTQQLIAGGRHPELRVRPTLEALDRLAASEWITVEARDQLTAAYLFLRRVEHRLQMVADEQTHALPEQREAVERFARFFGYESRDTFARDLLNHLAVVQRHYGRLFEGDTAGTVKLPQVDYAHGADDPRVVEQLLSLGFKKPAAAAQTARQWLEGGYRVFRNEATRAAFVQFLPALIAGLADAEDPDNAVVVFDRFLQPEPRSGLPGGVDPGSRAAPR